MESLAAALLPNTDGSSTETASQSNANLNRLLDEITFRLERRFLLRLFDKHGIPSSELDKLPPIPNCHCQCNSRGGRDAISSSAPSTSGYEDIEILRYRARMVVDNVVGDAIQCESDNRNLQYHTEDGAANVRSKEADMFATIGGPDNMSATNSLYVVRRAALRNLLKYTCKGKAGALLHLTDYLQQQIDNIDEENAALDAKAKTRKPKVRFDPIVEENNEEFVDAIDEYDDILPELTDPIDRSKRVIKIQAGSGESQSENPVPLDSNYTFNLRKFARHSLSKYLHKADAAAAMIHLFESTIRLELADDFAEIHASDSDMQELLHTPYFGSVASSGAATKKKHDTYPNRYNRSTKISNASPDWNRKSRDVSFFKDPEKKYTDYRSSSPNPFSSGKEDTRRYPEKTHSTRDDRYNNICSYCRSYINEIDGNMTTNNSNHQYLPSELKSPKIQNDTAIRGASTTSNAKKEKNSIGMLIENDHTEDTGVEIGDFYHQKYFATDMFKNKNNAEDINLSDCSKARDVEAPQLESKAFEYNSSTKKVIRLESTSSSNRPKDVKDQEITGSVSQKVGYFDRILNPSTEDVRAATKKAESIDISDEARVKIGFWEKMCGCCHSNPYK